MKKFELWSAVWINSLRLEGIVIEILMNGYYMVGYNDDEWGEFHSTDLESIGKS